MKPQKGTKEVLATKRHKKSQKISDQLSRLIPIFVFLCLFVAKNVFDE
jgi:hypothetical protein